MDHVIKMFADIRHVIPMELENKIDDLRERESHLSWDYGMIANEIYQYIVANNLPYTKLEACGYLARMTDNDRAPNTILRYAQVAEFFANKKSWERYEFLPFSHFELAMRMGDRWREVLDKAVSLMAMNFGRPPSRAKLERIFFPDLVEKQLENVTPPEPPYDPRLGTARLEVLETEDDAITDLLAQLQAKLGGFQRRHPGIAPLIAQALIIISKALESMNDTAKECEETA